MKLLPKEEYKKVEELLRTFGLCASIEEPYKSAMNDIIEFFNDKEYGMLLDIFYLNRYKYVNRLPTNEMIFIYLSSKLNIPKPTLYLMRKEMVYKAAMIFYKYDIL